MTSTLQVVMPIGGLGSRFAKAGYHLPKPLIPVRGTPMYQLALTSLDAFDGQKKLYAIVRQEHQDLYGLADRLFESAPLADVCMLPSNTRGAAETVSRVLDRLDPDLPVIVMDCDLRFRSSDFFASIAEEALPFDAALLSFESTDPRYSYAVTNEAGEVLQTAEKNPISNQALIGAYFFSRASLLKRGVEALLSKSITPEMPEYYMSLVFNELLREKKKVQLFQGEFDSFGTPVELRSFLGFPS